MKEMTTVLYHALSLVSDLMYKRFKKRRGQSTENTLKKISNLHVTRENAEVGLWVSVNLKETNIKSLRERGKDFYFHVK